MIHTKSATGIVPSLVYSDVPSTMLTAGAIRRMSIVVTPIHGDILAVSATLMTTLWIAAQWIVGPDLCSATVMALPSVCSLRLHVETREDCLGTR
jgi:hypothetical protein